MDDVCSVCLDPLGAADLCIPGCRHRLHVACALQCAQFDARCPVCRQTPDGVTLRDEEPPSHAVTMITLSVEEGEHVETMVRDAMSTHWRQYADRRRRMLRTQPRLQQALASLRTLRRDMNTHIRLTQRIYDARCRDVWRSDAQLVQMRKQLGNMRRRERRLETFLEARIAPTLGPAPDS